MKLILEQYDSPSENITINSPDDESLSITIKGIDWSRFTFLTLQENSKNWIQISGNLADDGLAIVIEKNGIQEVSQYPPQSIMEIEDILSSYLNNKPDGFVKFFKSQENLSQDYHNWKVRFEHQQLTNKRTKLIAVLAALFILAFSSWALYLWFSHEFKFIGHETSTTVATVVKTKYRPGYKSIIQIAKYKFNINEVSYVGYFRASTARIRKHKIGEQVKVKYAIDDPSISKRVATYKSKYNITYPSTEQ